MPYTVNTLDEHLDMLMVCHHLNPAGARGRRVRRVAHPAGDDGGRRRAARPRRDQHDVVRFAGDGPRRRSDHAHLADGARHEGGARTAAGDTRRHDNLRIRRYVAKYTINPARAHGIADYVGSIEVGKWADLVLWSPAFFGVKPDLIIKGGMIAAALMGDPERVDPDAGAGALPPDVRRASDGAAHR